MSRIRSKATYANVVATLALFLALGGASYAAFRLPKRSVGTRQLRNGAVTSAKVRNRSLRARDFKAGQLPSGERGPAGSARAYAEVNAGGVSLAPSFKPGAVKGFTAVSNPSTGLYCLTPEAGIDAHTSAAVVSPLWESGYAGSPEHAYRWEQTPNACPDGDFVVVTLGTGSMTEALDFSIVVP
jgi:hypothetical protein